MVVVCRLCVGSLVPFRTKAVSNGGWLDFRDVVDVNVGGEWTASARREYCFATPSSMAMASVYGIHVLDNQIGRNVFALEVCSQVPRRPFLLPNVNALRLSVLPFLSSVGDFGLSFPDRELLVCEDDEDSDVDRLRQSSARTSSRETLRCGCV